MADRFLIIKKTGNNIVNSLKTLIDLLRLSNEFSSDNGREFVNNEVNNFCNLNIINFISVRPYNPKKSRSC